MIRRAGVWEHWCWLLKRRRRFRVSGASMEPTLRSGDEVLGEAPGRLEVGDVVIARHPFRSDITLIKRVGAIRDDGRIVLRGDNPAASSDSARLGSVPPNHVIARVTSTLPA